MDEEIKKFIEEQKRIVEEIRKKQDDTEKGIFTKAEQIEFEKKANTRYDEITKQLTEMKTLQSRMDDFETKMNRPGGFSQKGDEISLEAKAYNKWLRFGKGALVDEELSALESNARTSFDPKVLKAFDIPESKVLTISGDTGVSYLAPGEYVASIIKGVTEISPMRTLCDVKPTSSDFSEIPKRTGQFAAQWVAEIGSKSETTGLTYGMERIPNHEMYALVKVSKRSLEDSAFNLEAELTSEFAEQFAKAEGTAFVTGDSLGKPEGFTVNGDVDITTIVHDASDAAILLPGLISLMYFLKSAYMPGATLVGKRATIALLRSVKDANNKYYWEPDFQKGTPGSFMGTPIVEVPDMATLADGTKGMAIGDFKKGYVISDRVQIEIQRLVELYAESGQVGFIARKRVGGQVVLAEAIAIGVGQA